MSNYADLPALMRDMVLPLRSNVSASPTVHALGVRAGDLFAEGASAIEDLLEKRGELVLAAHAYLQAEETDDTIGHTVTRDARDRLLSIVAQYAGSIEVSGDGNSVE